MSPAAAIAEKRVAFPPISGQPVYNRRKVKFQINHEHLSKSCNEFTTKLTTYKYCVIAGGNRVAHQYS